MSDSISCREHFARPVLLVLASTYPRWNGDHEPGFVHELARRLTDRFEVVVVCPQAPGALQHEWLDDVEVHRYRYAPQAMQTLVNDGGIVANLRRHRWKLFLVPGFVLALAWKVLRLIRSRRVDVVHAHWLVPQGFVLASLGKWLRRAPPFLVTSHGADLFALRSWPLPALKRWVLREAATVTIVSEGMRAGIESLGFDADGVHVEPMGVDLAERFRPDPAVPRSQSELLFVGRLVEKKGLRHLLEALPLIRMVRPDVHLTVAGFGPELTARKRQVAALGLDEVVSFVGSVQHSQLPELYRRAALFVAPFVQAAGGDQDGLGLVLVEALGCGCPVVVSGLPATEALAASCQGVDTVTPGDPQALARGVLAALASPVEPRPQDIADFDWARRTDAYARLLGDMVRRA